MSKVLVFVVEVEDDQEHSPIGSYFDVSNNTWDFIDARLAAVINPDEANHDLTNLVRKVLHA